jgi:hypothetical protein
MLKVEGIVKKFYGQDASVSAWAWRMVQSVQTTV